jgi:oxygen-independent coproporphyrinogen-3 oxidase
MLFLQRDINAYAKMLDNGFKPLMVLAEQPSLQAIYNLVMRQMEMGYINLNILAKNFGEKVTELLPLIDIWEKNGLVKKGAELIWLTQAGRFWQMNLTQSIMECIELIFNDIMENEVQRVAEQG